MLDFVNAIPHINKYGNSKRKRSLYHIGHASIREGASNFKPFFIYSNSFPYVLVGLYINKMVEL